MCVCVCVYICVQVCVLACVQPVDLFLVLLLCYLKDVGFTEQGKLKVHCEKNKLIFRGDCSFRGVKIRRLIHVELHEINRKYIVTYFLFRLAFEDN